MRKGVILAILVAAPAALLAAGPPAALTQVSGGPWEISGLPGSHAPVRECVSDVLTLAQFEHRSRHCTRPVVSEGKRSTVIDYSCGGAGFGHSELQVITPRSLRISTQGISDQLPFGYVIQARRVGECQKSPASSRH